MTTTGKPIVIGVDASPTAVEAAAERGLCIAWVGRVASAL